MSPQSYYIGGKIRAIDYNEFVNDINEIVGTGAGTSGYGMNNLVVSPITPGTKVKASHWDALLTSIIGAATHQGTTVSIPTSTADPSFPAPGRLIELLPDLENDILNVRSNKLNYDISNMDINSNTISSSKAYVAPGSGTPNWQGTVYYEFKVLFTSSDEARHFFNTGGEVRIDPTLTNYDVSNAQSLDWSTLLTDIGYVKFGINSTVSSNTVGTPGVGFVDLTTTYQLVYTKGGTGDYSGNQINVQAKLNGTDIDIRVSFDDAHAADGGTDYVDGILTVSVDEQIANGTTVQATSPTYSHITQL